MQRRNVSKEDVQRLGMSGNTFERQTAEDISSATQVHIELDGGPSGPTYIEFYSESDVYYFWDTSPTTANDTSEDLIWPSGNHQKVIPLGLVPDANVTNNKIYLHILQVTSVASKKFRYAIG